MGVRRERGLLERLPSCLALGSGACARAPGEVRDCGAQDLNGALGSRRTGWISCSLGGAAQPSPGPGSEAGDASHADVQELPEYEPGQPHSLEPGTRNPSSPPDPGSENPAPL